MATNKSEKSDQKRQRDDDFYGQRPRRLDSETLSYLKQIESRLADDDIDDDEREVLVNNVFEELTHKEGSAASDRNVNTLIESLLLAASPAQLRAFVSNLLSYMVFLSTNRYSSHVLQTIFRLAGAAIESELNGEVTGEENTDAAPSMSTFVLKTVEELSPHWTQLFQDASGSHVCRSIFLVLAGVEIVPDKRGKSARHRHQGSGFAPAPEKQAGKKYSVPEDFASILESIVESILQWGPDDIIKAACHENAGPLLQMLLRVIKERDGSSDRVIKSALVWEKSKKFSKSITSLASDRVGSHFIESVIETSSPELFEQIVQRCFLKKQKEYIDDPLGNFVLQKVYQEIKSKAQLKLMLDELEEYKFVKLLKANRSGILWRAAEASLRLKESYSKVAEGIINAAQSLSSERSIVQTLLGIGQLSSSDRATLNVAGARIIQNLLQFPPMTVKRLAESVAALPQESILSLAKDGTASRCVIEPVLDGPDEFADSKKRLVESCKGHFASLACERFGCYFVQKGFKAMNDADTKALIAEELLAAQTRVAGTSYGSLTLNALNVQLYKKDKKRWLDGVEKKDKVSKLFQDLLEDDNNESKVDDKSAAQEGKSKKQKKKKDKKSSGKDSLNPFLQSLGFAAKDHEEDEGTEVKRKRNKDTVKVNQEDTKSSLSFVFDALRGGDGKEEEKSGQQNKKSKSKKRRATDLQDPGEEERAAHQKETKKKHKKKRSDHS